MKRRVRSLTALLTCTLLLAACTDRSPRSDWLDPVNSGDTSATPATDEWLGQWNGPEGTFLRLEGGKGKYEITIQNLDGPRTYQGAAAGPQIEFSGTAKRNPFAPQMARKPE